MKKIDTKLKLMLVISFITVFMILFGFSALFVAEPMFLLLVGMFILLMLLMVFDVSQNDWRD